MRKTTIVPGSLVLFAVALPLHAQAPPPPGVSLLEAVQSTLLQNPQLKIQHLQVDVSRAARQQAAGAFDFYMQSSLLQQRVNNPLTVADQTADATTVSDQAEELTTFTFQANKQFRDGVLFSPSFGLSRTVDNLVATTGSNASIASLQVTIPLLQGRGKSAVDAVEIAASQEVTATTLDETQLITQFVTATALDYWNLVAAYKVLAIDVESEQRGAQYRDNVQILIDADDVPRNDVNAAVANLAQRAAARALAAQQLIAARQQLALDMGSDARQILTSFHPSDDFPESETARSLPDEPVDMRSYLDAALVRRSDYLAAKLRVQEGEVLVRSARNRVLPQINIVAAVGYTGLETGRQLTALLAPAYSGTQGPNATGGITYSFPVGNNLARGVLAQNLATTAQSVARAADVARNISASIVTAVAATRNALIQAFQARQSVASYKVALLAEQDKYRLGTGSIVEILTVEDLLTNAMLSQVQAELAYAQSIVQFRYAAGILLAPDQSTQSFSRDLFRSLPSSAP